MLRYRVREKGIFIVDITPQYEGEAMSVFVARMAFVASSPSAIEEDVDSAIFLMEF